MSSEQNNYFFSPHFSFMRNWFSSSSNISNLPPSCDEELVDDADEPPDSHYFPVPEASEFAKQPLLLSHNPLPKESLLTRALLTSPSLHPVRDVQYDRGMSHMSIWSSTSASTASTADLISDGSPSRANTPSPTMPPMFLNHIASILSTTKPCHNPIEVMEPKEDVIEGLGRKRCISFACGGVAPPSRRGSTDSIQTTHTTATRDEAAERPEIPAKKPSALTFVCAQKEESERPRSASIRFSPPASRTIDFAHHSPRTNISIAPAVVNKPTFETTPATPAVEFRERQLYDTESAADSWYNQPIDKSRLLRVDDVLRKEKDIRKLSEEALDEDGDNLDDEDEEDQDNEDGEDEDEDYDEDEEDGDDEDEEGEDEDEEDLEVDDASDYGYGSGNKSDNDYLSDADSSDSDDDDEDASSISALHPPLLPPLSIPRPPTPELPDSTDFVCGTFDEDQPLEAAYLSCLEQRKQLKHKPVPQDIDPSFPTSDPEDESEDEGRKSPRSPRRSKRGSPASDTSRRGRMAHSPPPRGRMHSPAPVRGFAMGRSPAPSHRSRNHSPPPMPSRRGSRVLSPAPPTRRSRAQFSTGTNIVRARSLPRRRTAQRIVSAAGSPSAQPTKSTTKPTKPVLIKRGAADIVKGLEKRRERRRRKEEGVMKGEGVEKMREIGMEVCGRGNGGQRVLWVISA